MEVDSIPQQAQEPPAQVETVALVVGILANLGQDRMKLLCDGLLGLSGSPRIVVLHSEPAASTAAPQVQNSQENSPLTFLPWSELTPDASGAPVQSISAACQSLFSATEKLGARASCLVASEIEHKAPEWVCELVNPLLETDADLVIPSYAPRHFQGLLNTGILYPLMRSLYGKRIHNPLGPDVGVSRRLSQKLLSAGRTANGAANPSHPLASLTATAVCDNMKISQVHVGARAYPPTDWVNMSSLISQVLGPVFLEMERWASCWQRTKGSTTVSELGEPLPAFEEVSSLDLNRMGETFQLGVRDLQEIWSLVLPPATLFELRKLSRMKPDQLVMPDALWARIIYDFALAHRLRTINRDHLLRSMTPLYMAWVGSYAREIEGAEAPVVADRIEQLALAYEAAKPYFISRWRWPDKFNP